MALLDYNREELRNSVDGSNPYTPGIWNSSLVEIFHRENDRGQEYINFVFRGTDDEGKLREYTFVQKYTGKHGSKLKFAVSIVDHIVNKIIGQDAFDEIVDNLEEDNWQGFAEKLEEACAAAESREVRIKISQTVNPQTNKAIVGFNQINRPFVDIAGGNNLMFNRALDVEEPQEKVSGTPTTSVHTPPTANSAL